MVFKTLLLFISLSVATVFFQSHVSIPVIEQPILFVSRTIPCCGSVYMAEANALPGIGGFSKYQVAAPAYLCILYPDKSIDTLIDGSKPESNSFHLIDISSPCLSWDAQKIVFAGLPDGNYPLGNHNQVPKEHNAWRIYSIHIDGSNLKKISPEQSPLNLSQFSPLALNGLKGYDDTHPVWLPDGRICFSSTRFPGIAMYNVVRTSNLYVVNEDGSELHRITSEKNGADRPVVDPVTGKIVFSRWWRNFYWPYDPMTQLRDHNYPDGWASKDGLTSKLDNTLDGESFMFNNNAFLLSEINPDGTGLRLFSAHYRNVSANSAYGGSFDPDGNFVGNWFPIEHLTESSGFGGIKRFYRGSTKKSEGLIGITGYGNFDYYIKDPTSYGIFKGEYATEPFATPSGDILFSKASNPYQDYGLWKMDSDGSNPILLFDHPGTTELNAQLVSPRKIPPIIPDQILQMAEFLPPTGMQDLWKEGSFVFDCRNIFFNSPVDDGILAAPGIGKLSTVRFFAGPMLDKQYGSVEALDYPLLYNELPSDEFGRVLEPNSPANVPLFEQARSDLLLGYSVPRTGGGIMDGAAHVTGFNYGRPGQLVTCVGCHAGHSLIPVPEDPEKLLFTNLAPGAKITASNAMNAPGYVIDKKNYTASKHWFTSEGIDPKGQWLKLKWAQQFYAKSIVLHNIPDTNRLRVNQCRVTIYSDTLFQQKIDEINVSEKLSNKGTVIPLNHLPEIQSMQIDFLDVSGGIYHWNAASIGEIEVIGSAVHPDRFKEICDCKGLAYGRHSIDSCGQCLLPEDPRWNDCLTNTSGLTTNSSLSIFPSLSNESITVTLGKNQYPSDLVIRIINTEGKLMKQLKSVKLPVQIDVRDLRASLYLIVIESKEKKWIDRFIKTD